MKKYYIMIVVLLAIFGLIYFKCLSKYSEENSCSRSGNNVDVTYYFNPGCPHCRNFTPVWKDFVSEGGANFREINCAANPDKCMNVRGVPWVVFSRNGEHIPFTGNRNKQSLQAFLNTIN